MEQDRGREPWHSASSTAPTSILDSPLRSLALRDPALADWWATRPARRSPGSSTSASPSASMRSLLSGDLYDGDQTSMRTALSSAPVEAPRRRRHRHLRDPRQPRPLGPHHQGTGAAGRGAVFGGRARGIQVETRGGVIAIHGLSFAQSHAPESLLPRYRRRSRARSTSASCTRASAAHPATTRTRPCAAADLGRERLPLLGARPRACADRSPRAPARSRCPACRRAATWARPARRGAARDRGRRRDHRRRDASDRRRRNSSASPSTSPRRGTGARSS